MADKQPERLQGEASIEPVRTGTASAHRAIVLHTDGGESLILQRIGGNPFADPETRRLAGHRVTVKGYRLRKTFRYSSAEVEK